MVRKPIVLAVLGIALLSVVGWIGLQALSEPGDPAVVAWADGDEQPVAETVGEALEAAGEPRVDRQAVEVPLAEMAEEGEDEPRQEVAISGRVLDSFERPLPGAHVVLELARGWRGPGGPEGRGGERGGRNRIRRPVETGADGRFEFRGRAFPGSTVTLRVTHRDHAALRADRPMPPEQARVDVGDLGLLTGGSVLGSVVGPEGVGIPGAAVRLLPEPGNPVGWQREEEDGLQTDQNGFFRLDHVVPGDYRVEARAVRHTVRATEPVVIADAVEEHLDPIELGPGFQITGVVFAPTGKAVEGAEVVLLGRGGNRTRSDAEGRFAIDHLPRETFSVRVQAEGYLSWQQEGLEAEDAPALVVNLQQGLRISGEVHDALTGAAVARYAARIRRLRDLPEREQAREAQVRELMDRLAQQQSAEVAIRQVRGAEAAADPARMAAAEADVARRQVEIAAVRGRLEEARRGLRELEGRPRFEDFRGGDGRGPGGRGPEARGGGGRFGGEQRLGDVVERPDGRFSFTGLDEGVYVVDIGSPDHQRTRTEPIELRLGTSPHVAVTAERGLFVEGVVVSAAGLLPLAGAHVELTPVLDAGNPPPLPSTDASSAPRAVRALFGGRGRGPAVVSAETDKLGRFALRHAPAGRYVVVARADGHANATSAELDLRADVQGVELALGLLAALRGTVEGIPAGREAEAQVVAFGGPGGMRTTRVKADKTYVLEDLQPGGYLVRAFVGDMRAFFGREMRRMMSPGFEGPRLDVTLQAGEQKTFDPVVVFDPVGEVVGSIVLNGAPAKGLRVQLRPVDGAAGAGFAVSFGAPVREGGGRGGRDGGRGPREAMVFGGGPGGFDGNALTDARGEFALKGVPEGRYVLTVRSAQRGRNELHRVEIAVTRDTRNEQRLSLLAGDLQGEVRADGLAAEQVNGSVRLYAGVRERPADPRAFAQQSRMLEVRVQAGKLLAKELVPGDYLLELRIRGRQRVEQAVTVGMGTTVVYLTAGAPQQPKKAAGPAKG